jgi:hypothetical protein
MLVVSSRESKVRIERVVEAQAKTGGLPQL